MLPHPFRAPINPLFLSDGFSHFCNFIYHLDKYYVALASVVKASINEFVTVNLELSGKVQGSRGSGK